MAGLLTDLDIVNAACAEIGEAPLQALDEEVDVGQSAALLYNAVLEFNLGIYKFSFAKQIRQLTQNALGNPLAGFDYVFDMPAERIGNPLYVTDDPTDPDRRFNRYAIVGPQIHASAKPLHAMILFRAPVYAWSGTFRGMMITALAAAFAYPMTGDRALAEDKTRQAYGTPSDDYRGGKMRAAINDDSFTNPPRSQDRDTNPLTAAWRS